jgi:TolB-like protein/Tfp pilus assembly protein PilF
VGRFDCYARLLAEDELGFADRERILFEIFEVDLQARQLSRNGHKIKLQDLPFGILTMLLKEPGRLVTREELRQMLWPRDTFVDFEAGLNTAIRKLRNALGDDSQKPRFVETVPRHGYRFIAQTEMTRLSHDSLTTTHDVDSLAVLPLANATGDPETEYLGDGISESIINLLSQLPNLRVVPRTSAFRYKGREADLKTVGRDLKVRTVLTGKMIQRGVRLVVQTELVDVVNDAQLWGGQFNRKLEDIFDVQEELARQISENLRLRLTPEDEKRLARRPTQNRDAYQFLLKAQYHVNRPGRESLNRALVYARQAIEADPGYAEAYAWMSHAYVVQGIFDFVPPRETFPRAKAAAQKALEIDDSLAEAHAVLGHVRMVYEWDWSGAEHICKKAIELNPNYPWGHAVWSDWLSVMGRFEEAIAEERIAVELDPLSPGLNARLGFKLSLGGDHDRALEQLQKALELDPNLVFTNYALAITYARKRMYEAGLATCQKVVALCGSDPFGRALSCLILTMAGKTDEAQKILSELKGHPKLDSWSLTLLAMTCSVMDMKTETFELLEVAYQQRASWLVPLAAYRGFRNVRTDPRFADLLRRMGLPQGTRPNAS